MENIYIVSKVSMSCKLSVHQWPGRTALSHTKDLKNGT